MAAFRPRNVLVCPLSYRSALLTWNLLRGFLSHDGRKIEVFVHEVGTSRAR